MRTKTIGIVGGMGPAAGIDVFRAITVHTPATQDQDHLNVWLASLPGKVPDRTEFLEGTVALNPAEPVAEIIIQLASVGADIIGLACNTMHVPPIFDELTARIERSGIDVQLVNMVNEVVDHVAGTEDRPRRVGVLGTRGSIGSDVYGIALRGRGHETLYGDLQLRESVHAAIYDPETGIKATSGPASGRSVRVIERAIDSLVAAGAEVIILGCTELPLVITADPRGRIALVDPSLILAKALVDRVAPGSWREGELT